MTRHSLAALKSTQLKHLAFLTGLNSTGTKAQVVETLARELGVARVGGWKHTFSDDGGGGGRGGGRNGLGVEGGSNGLNVKKGSNGRDGGARILSIDMGIRNLAYCVLDMPNGTGFLRHTGRYHREAGGHGNGAGVLAHLKLSAWNRVAVNEAASSTATTLPTASGSSLQTTHSDNIGTATDSNTSPPSTPATPPTPSSTTIPFNPSTYAKLAYNLIASLLHTYNPTTILIERQRWRSGGAATVLEWTIRVNMFEGMLHAVLETLRGEQEVGKGRFPDVYSVSPKRVFDFWAEEKRLEGEGDVDVGVGGKSVDAAEDEEQLLEVKKTKEKKKTFSGSKTKAQKALKIDIVQSWLRPSPSTSQSQLPCADNIIDIRNAFLDKLAKRKGRGVEERSGDATTRKKVTTSLSSNVHEEKFPSPVSAVVDKLDDLADCLLQGVTWVQWEANRYAVVDGVDLNLVPSTTVAPASGRKERGKQIKGA